MRGARGEEATGRSLYLCILYIWVCVQVTEVDSEAQGEGEKQLEF